MYFKRFVGLLGLLLLQGCGSGTLAPGTQPPVPVTKQFVNWSTVQTVAVDSSTTTAIQTAGGVYYADIYGLGLVDDTNLEQVGPSTRLVNSEISDGAGHSSYDAITNVALNGNVAVLAVTPGCIGWCFQGGNELRLYDISDRSKATYLATLTDSPSPEALLADGNYLYVTGSSAGLLSNEFAVIDISNPKAPKKLSAIDILGSGQMAKVGNLIYVSLVSESFGWDWQNIRVIDVSNPTAPVMLGPPDSAGSANITFSPIVMSGSIAYVSDLGLKVVDLTDPLSPSLVKTIAMPVYAIASYGNYLYVACGTQGLRIFDITDPKSPVLIKTITTATSIRFVSVTNGRGIYITDGVVNSSMSPEMKIFYVNQTKTD